MPSLNLFQVMTTDQPPSTNSVTTVCNILFPGCTFKLISFYHMFQAMRAVKPPTNEVWENRQTLSPSVLHHSLCMNVCVFPAADPQTFSTEQTQTHMTQTHALSASLTGCKRRSGGAAGQAESCEWDRDNGEGESAKKNE